MYRAYCFDPVRRRVYYEDLFAAARLIPPNHGERAAAWADRLIYYGLIFESERGEFLRLCAGRLLP